MTDKEASGISEGGMMKKKTLWKSMLSGLRSGSGNIGPWVKGEWRKHDAPLKMCESGFHASENVIDAMRYVNAEVIAEAEVRGEHLEQNDKQVWGEMRILRAWEWTKPDSVSLAIFAAELVIGNYEKRYPDDKRPRKAIKAAKEWLKDPSEGNRRAAYAAAAAAYAASASAAADSAAYAFAAADYAAYAAADYAAYAAYASASASAAAYAAADSAADSAAYAAYAAHAYASADYASAREDVKAKCHEFVMERLRKKDAEKTGKEVKGEK